MFETEAEWDSVKVPTQARVRRGVVVSVNPRELMFLEQKGGLSNKQKDRLLLLLLLFFLLLLLSWLLLLLLLLLVLLLLLLLSLSMVI